MDQEKARTRKTKSEKADLIFPVSRVERYLKGANVAAHVRGSAAVYLSAVLEYLTKEMVELSGLAAKDFNKNKIDPKFIQMAIKNDEELNEMLNNVHIASAGCQPVLKSLDNSETAEPCIKVSDSSSDI